MSGFEDWRPAPSIRDHPDLYELENEALDPGGLVLAAMREHAPWRDSPTSTYAYGYVIFAVRRATDPA